MAVLESIVRVMSPRNRSKIPWPTLESIVRARSPRNRPKLPYLSCLPNALARGAFVCPSDAVRWGCGMQECPKMRLQMLVYSCGNGGGAEEKNESERKQRERGEGKEMRETEGGEFSRRLADRTTTSDEICQCRMLQRTGCRYAVCALDARLHP